MHISATALDSEAVRTNAIIPNQAATCRSGAYVCGRARGSASAPVGPEGSTVTD